MSDYVVKEFDKKLDKCIKLHYVPVKKPSDEGFYREITSWSAFAQWFPKNFLKTRYCARRENKSKRLSVEWKFDFDVHRETKLSKMMYDGLPEIHHASVQDFYEYVGYDKKLKKLINKMDN